VPPTATPEPVSCRTDDPDLCARFRSFFDVPPNPIDVSFQSDKQTLELFYAPDSGVTWQGMIDKYSGDFFPSIGWSVLQALDLSDGYRGYAVEGAAGDSDSYVVVSIIQEALDQNMQGYFSYPDSIRPLCAVGDGCVILNFSTSGDLIVP